MDKIYHVCVNCTPYHIDNCDTCFGYGFKKGTSLIIAAGEVDELTECDPCLECGGNLTNEHLYELEKESKKNDFIGYKVASVKGSSIKTDTLWKTTPTNE